MEFHHLAEADPFMTDEEFAALLEDIRVNGQRLAIILFEGKILDGRHRYRVCLKLGIEPRYETFTGTEEQARALVDSLNYYRRHLTYDQKRQRVVRERGKGKSYRQIEAELNIPKSTVVRMVQESGVPSGTPEPETTPDQPTDADPPMIVDSAPATPPATPPAKVKGRDGKSYPASKPAAPKPVPSSTSESRTHDALGKEIPKGAIVAAFNSPCYGGGDEQPYIVCPLVDPNGEHYQPGECAVCSWGELRSPGWLDRDGFDNRLTDQLRELCGKDYQLGFATPEPPHPHQEILSCMTRLATLMTRGMGGDGEAAERLKTYLTHKSLVHHQDKIVGGRHYKSHYSDVHLRGVRRIVRLAGMPGRAKSKRDIAREYAAAAYEDAPTGHGSPASRVRQGVALANEALNHLFQIRDDDELREQAIEIIAEWVERSRK